MSVGAVQLTMVIVGTGASTAPPEAAADPVAQAEPAAPVAMPGRSEDLTGLITAAGPGPAEPQPAARAVIAVATAMAQIGLPYVWGGNGPGAGDSGFDCSGLTTFSYAVAGVRLPRTAQSQFCAGPNLRAGAALEPGDLTFCGTVLDVQHVGMYIGHGRMVNAPTFGKPILNELPGSLVIAAPLLSATPTPNNHPSRTHRRRGTHSHPADHGTPHIGPDTDNDTDATDRRGNVARAASSTVCDRGTHCALPRRHAWFSFGGRPRYALGSRVRDSRVPPSHRVGPPTLTVTG
jgi:cell wall-associated NlpC family hydrolase